MPYFPRAGVPFSQFIKQGEIGGRATRSSQTLNIPFFKSASGQRTFYYRIVSIWNFIGRWGNQPRWGNPPVHIISHFNLMTFTWYVGWPSKANSPVCNPLSRTQILPCKLSRWGNPPSRGPIRDTSNSRKIHFCGDFASLLKVTIESHSTEGCSKSNKGL